MIEVEVVVLLAAVLGVVLAAVGRRGTQARRLARARLAPATEDPGARSEERGASIRTGLNPRSATHGGAPIGRAARAGVGGRPYLVRQRLLPWLVGALLGGVLHFFAGLHPTFAVVVGAMVGLLGAQLEASRAERKALRIQTQLGEAIDLMVGALQAGAGVLHALEAAATESARPLRPQLEEVLGRIRYGDEPGEVLRDLEARVPLETFRLFASALAVHWEVGGSLAPTLATVGRTVRDRIATARRVRSLTTEARASVVAVLGVSYFLAVIMWRSDPERMAEFLGSPLGRNLVAASALLQAIGIVWSAAISRVKY